MNVQTEKRFAHLPRLEAHEVGRPKHRLRNPIASGLGDFVVQPIWDYYGVAANTATARQEAFSVGRGQQYTPTGGAAFTKTEQTTSMDIGRQLQAPERLLVRCVSVYLDNEMNQLDVARFLSQTLLDWRISTKSFFQLPLIGKAPAGGGAWAQQTNNNVSVTGNGLPSSSEGYSITAPGAGGLTAAGQQEFPQIEGVLLEQQQAFHVVVDPTLAAHVAAVGFTTQAAGAIPAGIGVRAFFFLEGTKVRAVL